MGSLFPVLPIIGHQKEEDGEDFQTTDEHIGTHEPLAWWGNNGKGAGGTRGTCGRTDVAQHADAAAKGGIDVRTEQGVARHSNDDQQDIYKDEGKGLTHLMLRHYLLADTHTEDGSRMEHEDELVEDALGTDDDADDLDATCCAARTGTDGHDDDGRHPEGCTPSYVVELLC